MRHNTVTKSKSNVAVTAIISPAGVGGGGQGDAQKMLLEEELSVKSMYFELETQDQRGFRRT